MTDTTVDSPFVSRYHAEVSEWMEFMGYRQPMSFIVGAEGEYEALRGGVAIQDYSMLFKWFIEGPDARATVDAVVTRDVSALPPGRIAYSAVVNEDGGMLDDVTILAMSDDVMLVMGGNPDLTNVLRSAAPAGTSVSERRTSYGVLSVQGPRSRELLQRLTASDLSHLALPYYGSVDADVAGVPVTVMRVGFTGELGYELLVRAEYGSTLFDAVWAQKDLGVRFFSGQTLMVARLEAGYMLAHVDFDETVTPFESRLGWTVDLNKPTFRGKDALIRRQSEAASTVVTIEAEATAEELTGAQLSVNGEPVGFVTMAVRSPQLGGRTAALARVSLDAAAEGTDLVIAGRDEAVAKVRPTILDSRRARR